MVSNNDNSGRKPPTPWPGSGEDPSLADGQSLDPVVQAHIGRELRALFDGIASAPVPDRFLTLLAKLEEKRDRVDD